MMSYFFLINFKKFSHLRLLPRGQTSIHLSQQPSCPHLGKLRMTFELSAVRGPVGTGVELHYHPPASTLCPHISQGLIQAPPQNTRGLPTIALASHLNPRAHTIPAVSIGHLCAFTFLCSSFTSIPGGSQRKPTVGHRA